MGHIRKLYERLLLSGQYRKEEIYWLECLKEPPGICSFPYDMRGGERKRGFQPESLDFSFNGELCRKILQLSNESDLRLHLVLLAAVFLLLHKYSGKADLIIGIPVLKQDTQQDFINTVLPIRKDISPDDSFKEILFRLRDMVRGAERHQNYPVELLLSNLGFRYTPVRQFPLFDVTAMLENIHSSADLDHVRTNLEFSFRRTGESLEGTVTFNNRLYRIETIRRMCAHFVNLLDRLLDNRDILVAELDILHSEEKDRLLRQCNRSAVEFPREDTIVSLFSRQVDRHPHRVAWCFGHSQTTYNLLDMEADSLSMTITQHGILPGMIVALLLERSGSMITAILAVLKAGAAYLPIDADFPADRISFMITDSAAPLILSDSASSTSLSGGPTPLLDIDRLETPGSQPARVSGNPAPGDTAYIIYTSGTTGKPKGVMVSHRNVVRLMDNDEYLFDFDHNDTWTMFHSYCFDFSVWEMYGALLLGGRLVVVPRDVAREPIAFRKLLARWRVTVLNQTPSAFYNLSTEESAGLFSDLAVRYVIFGGEELRPARLKDWRLRYPNARLINMFGITETTVHVTFKEIGAREIETDTCNIGIPLPTLSAFALDRYKKITPIGVAGELYVGGEGVSLGYLNRPELTDERFVENPFASGERLYRSGDLARMLENYEMEYLGRIDHQVQVRGFRVELGEIEAQVIQFGEITEAVVVARNDEELNKILVCYLVSPIEIDSHALRGFLQERAPEYMIPHYFIEIERLPLTANGKLDHSALPDPRVEIEDGFVEARSDHERLLVEIWQEVLEQDSIGVRDNFFVIGGDSIKAIKLLTEINDATDAGLKIVDLFLNETVEKLALLLDEARRDVADPVLDEVRREVEALKERMIKEYGLEDTVEDLYPMSDIQEGMAYHYLRDRDSGVYHDQMVHQLKYPDFDALVFRKALGMMVQKHEILRTSLNIDDFDSPMQVVYREIELDYLHHDLTHLDRQKQEAFLRNFIIEDRERPIEISAPPLWRFRTFRLDEENVVVLWVCHHAIMDGWSDASFKTELHNLYMQMQDGRNVRLRSLQNSYKTFVLEEIAEKRKEGVLNFWERQLDGYKRLSFGNSPSLSQNGTIKNIVFDLGERFYQACSAVSESLNTTVKNICFGAYLYMLYMISYEADLLVGLVCHNRPVCEDSEKILGCFLNTLPFRITIPSGGTCGEFIRLVDEKLLEIKQFERLSFFEIVKLVGEERGHENPLFDTVFNFMDFHVYRDIEFNEDSSGSGEESRLELQGFVRTNTPVNLDVDATLGAFIITFSYNTGLLDDSMAEKMCGYYRKILGLFVGDPVGSLERGAFIDSDEVRQLLDLAQGPPSVIQTMCPVHERFADGLDETSDHVAIVSTAQEMHLTYRELDKAAEQLAYRLKKRGAGLDDIVPIIVEPSVEMIVGLLGILKSNAAYLPIDPGYPAERTNFILRDCSARLLVTRDPLAEEVVFEGDVLNLIGPAEYEGYSSEEPSKNQPLDSLAYVIYTSGSSGEPKGVLVDHSNLSWYIAAFEDQVHLTSSDRVLQQASFTFDAFVEEMYPVLLAGGTLAIPLPEEILDSNLLGQFLNRHRVTMLSCSPLLLNEVNKLGTQTSIRTILCGGDRLIGSFADNLLPHASLFNTYGPTESTVCATYFEVNGQPTGPVPIGRPIAGCQAYILDREFKLMPYGTAGQLAIAGDGVTRGYLNRPRLTTEKFLPDPFLKKGKMYLTGDLARWLPEGHLDFLGRLDQQVKIRGYRIELGEIEHHLQEHPSVDAVVVVGCQNNGTDPYLCAYVTGGADLSSSALKQYLQEKVPHYMTPARFIFLDSLPLTPSGKPDRRALPEPDWSRSEHYQSPQGSLETGLAALFAEVLDVDLGIVGISDNFFDLGGHSIKATILISRVHKTFEVKIPISRFFKGPTVKEMAEFIKKSGKSRYDSIEPVEKKEFYCLSSAQKRLYFLQNLDPSSTDYNLTNLMMLKGGINKEKLEYAFQMLIKRHECFRTAIEVVENEPVQRVYDEVEFAVEYHEAPGHQAKELVQRFIRPFDLKRPPFLRVNIIQTGEQESVILMEMHHILTDAVSQDIIMGDFLALYTNRALQPLGIQYKDYTEFLEAESSGFVMRKQEEYWLRCFDTEIPDLQLPVDFDRADALSYEGETVNATIREELLERCKRLTSETDSTSFVLLLAVFTVLLSRYSGQEDIVIGTPVEGRNREELQNVAGFFVNILPMRNFPSSHKSFRRFLEEVKETVVAGFDNQAYQFDELVSKLGLQGSRKRNPLFDCVLNMNRINGNVNEDAPELVSDLGFEVKPFALERTVLPFDLYLNVLEEENVIHLNLNFSTGLFKKKTAESIVSHFIDIIGQVAAQPDILLADIQLAHDLLSSRPNQMRDSANQFDFSSF